MYVCVCVRVCVCVCVCVCIIYIQTTGALALVGARAPRREAHEYYGISMLLTKPLCC